jgi:hypothetical protein
MPDTVVATPFKPGTANNNPTTNAPANTNVINPLRKLRRADEASTRSGSDDWTELMLDAVQAPGRSWIA